MNMLKSVKELITHIKEVELDTIKMSQDSMMMLSKFIEKNNIELDEDAAKAIQYQDIISQQLSATIDAIDSVQKSIEIFENAYTSDEKIANDSLDKLLIKLTAAIDKAKDRRDAFSGQLGHANEDEIEFF
ncbi:MAG: hypothetical protein COB17_03270 [Sulfurimonas sp.]|nr:MAG: hypothetical protein COB17_03270 [Sulfurimonas sp.]